ncbi:RAD51-like protein 1 [Fistulifera solaris]|uniref:RAD51-like protein 1 n=1 Tax=Fistulifera solaris TaxID=1519565 RepID=A0A1Z5J625_FISSO|nr:RAD51-like protein 1 [Fistulifera solaris]|eukprot:GAX09352.1 RAD51-like protein 1 [Fistulifera solaris]
MSVAHRSIVRLPLEIFEGLCDDGNVAAIDLRTAISKQLKNVAKKKSFRTVYVKVLTVGPMLQMSVTSLMRALDPLLTYQECIEFRRRVAEACSPQPVTALHLLQYNSPHTRVLSTGLLPLDTSLVGGIRVGTLTELVGSAGSGKTQLAMQMIVQAAAKLQGAIFIDTERKLSLPRLQEIALEKYTAGAALLLHDDSTTQTAEQQFTTDDYVDPKLVLQNLSVYSPASMDELTNILSSMEEEILLRNEDAEKTPHQTFPVRLVVLDSIAAPARRDFAPGSGPQRAAAVMYCSQKLKQIADHLHLAVLIINQVGGSWNSDDKQSDVATRAALGTTWHHCVTTRIQLETVSNVSSTEMTNGCSASNPLRWASVVKSNIVGHGSKIPFTIDKAGLADNHLVSSTN